MVTIKHIHATEILDSRGNPTLETTVVLSDDMEVSASVPSGASVGKYEAVELRDKDATRYSGMGVLKSVSNVNTIIAAKLIGMDPLKQGVIDQMMIELDGTPTKAKLGANALLSVSLAVARAAAHAIKLPLYVYISELVSGTLPNSIKKMPTPIFNVINGGKHGAGNLDIQEFHVIPASIKPYKDALRMGDEIYQQLKKVLISRNAIHSVGDEGGFAPNLYTNQDALEAMMEAIRATPYKFGFDIFLGLDIAADHFLKAGRYHIKDRPTGLTPDEFMEYLIDIHKNYRLLILEDPFSEDDWTHWQKITETIGDEVLIVGDDLLVTNPIKLKKAIAEKACSAILIKPNQIGTLSETLQVVKIAIANNIKLDVSHRSGETNDTFIADLAVGVGAEYVKFGAPARGERIAKYNRLLTIESELKLT